MSEPLTTEVSTSVALGVHPDSAGVYAKDLDPHHPLGKQALHAVKDALTAAYEVQVAIDKAEKDIRTLTPPDAPTYVANGKLVRETGLEEQIAVAADRATQRALSTVERRGKELLTMQATLTNAVSVAIDHPERKAPVGIAEGAEIRAHIKSLPAIERMAFLSRAIDAGDKRTAAAVLHSPSYLSGLDQSTHELVRNLASHAFAPAETKILAGVTKAIDHLGKGAASLMARNQEVASVASYRAAKKAAILAGLK